MSITLKEISELAGCSIRTVNRVLWKSGPVAQELRERIEGIVNKYHYVPNMAARNLKTRRKNFAGVIINGSTRIQIFIRKLTDLVQKLGDEGFYPLLGKLDTEEAALESILREWTGLVEHVIFMMAPSQNTLFLLSSLSRRYGMHFTLVDAQGPVPEELSALFIDRSTGIYDAIQYLVQTGHRHILRFGNIPSRDAGWAKAYQTASPASVDFSHLKIDFPEYESGIRNGEAAFQDKPDAIFCDTDRAASGVLRYAIDHGIKIPKHCSLIGFDDDAMATCLTPRLSTIAHPLDEINGAATNIVSGKLPLATHLTFPTRFINRESILQKSFLNLNP